MFPNVKFPLLFCTVECSENRQKINIAPYGKKFYYLTYKNKILNLDSYIFEKFFTIKKFWDGLPVFAQQTIYHVCNEMRQSLVISCVTKIVITERTGNGF